ncbi:nitronate monooxygenase [Salinisphaera sp. T31B1]|uniref:NAD(P)H-dependent flavin oxidoreductase n=1 Tax=Salinisphaera sp. T31B1 TaxID=727963 RepID=UPI00333FA239
MKYDKRIVRLLGMQTPVIQAPMAGGTTTPELVAAVSESGGLGSIGAGYLSPEAITSTIEQTRERTGRGFAVNLFVPGEPAEDAAAVERSNSRLDVFRADLGIERPAPPARYAPVFDDQFEAVVAAHVPVFSFTFGALQPVEVARLKEGGTVVIGTATTVDEAIALAAIDVDMIVAQGAEAGGHRGTFMHPAEQALIGTMALVPQIVDSVSVPVIASGGIMDGRGVAAALMLGAGAVQMGSAFVVCDESGAQPAHREALLAGPAARETVVTRAFSGKAARGIRNRFIDELAPVADQLPDYPIQNAWTKDVRAAAGAQGRAEYMSLWAGQAAALAVKRSAAQIVDSIRQHLDAL